MLGVAVSKGRLTFFIFRLLELDFPLSHSAHFAYVAQRHLKSQGPLRYFVVELQFVDFREAELTSPASPGQTRM